MVFNKAVFFGSFLWTWKRLFWKTHLKLFLQRPEKFPLIVQKNLLEDLSLWIIWFSLIFSQTFSSTRKMQLWQPCRTFFAKNQHVLVQCLTILIKRFIFERKIFTSKLPLGHEEYCLSNSAKKFLAKSMIGFGSKYDNEHQKKYLFEIIQFLQRKFSWTRRKQF